MAAKKSRPIKTEMLKMRLDPFQRERFEDAARREGLDVSTWLRQVALREADRLSKKVSR